MSGAGVEVVRASGRDAALVRAEHGFVRRFAVAAPVPLVAFDAFEDRGDAITATRRPPQGRLGAPLPPAPERLAELVHWIASLDPDDVLDCGVLPRTTSVQNLARLFRDAGRLLASLPPEEAQTRDRLAGLFGDGRPPPAYAGPPRVVHGRLGREVIWCDDGGRVTAVGGWGHLNFGDPAVTLLRLYQWGGPDYVAAVVGAEGARDVELAGRVAFLARCAALFELHAALGASDAAAAARARRSLAWP